MCLVGRTAFKERERQEKQALVTLEVKNRTQAQMMDGDKFGPELREAGQCSIMGGRGTTAGFTFSTFGYGLILVLVKEDRLYSHILLFPLIFFQLCWVKLKGMQACRLCG